MIIRLLVLFVLVPFVELVLLLVLAHYTSAAVTIVTVVVTGLLGTALARSQGLRTVRQIERELAQGNMPTDPLLDAILILCAGALLLTPGLLTDAAGVSMLVPQIRRRYRSAIIRWIRQRFQVASFSESPTDFPPGSEVPDARVLGSREEDESK